MKALTIFEARAILVADEALDVTYETRLETGQLLGLAESDAWIKLVESARAVCEGAPNLIAERTP